MNFVLFEQDSPIIDFYPSNFKIDLNGKKYAWQGVALLPFVEEKRLWAALETVYPDLTEEESKEHSNLLVRTSVRGSVHDKSLKDASQCLSVCLLWIGLR